LNRLACCSAVVLAFVALGMANAFAREGQFVPAPYAAAAQVIRLAKLGDVRSQTQLGQMYATGKGVPQDYIEAAKWYYRAADRGDPRAQYELGVMYNKGQGVRRDYVLAELWLNLSASQAGGDDRDFVARMRDSVALKMTPSQLAAAESLARAWYRSPH
jgi:TPR repeat protein